jgi:hypothetical protein|tara:strand:- start:109 stop:339 length:231 start_codon:yes stop_codon:yes gene_type:complete
MWSVVVVAIVALAAVLIQMNTETTGQLVDDAIYGSGADYGYADSGIGDEGRYFGNTLTHSTASYGQSPDPAGPLYQ